MELIIVCLVREKDINLIITLKKWKIITVISALDGPVHSAVKIYHRGFDQKGSLRFTYLTILIGYLNYHIL